MFKTTKRIVQLAVTAAALFSVAAVDADTLISPDDTRINYYGRFDLSTPTMAVFAWPGCAFEANLPGPLIGMRLADGRGDYDVEIDGVLDTVVITDAVRDIIFGTAFTDELHRVRVTLRNEHHYNTASFRGFILADGKEPGPAPAMPSRKIEFIGDSYTAGYGIEGTDDSCSEEQLRNTTNVDKSFATLVTKAFHAQSFILGWSGAGMVRNYGEKTQRGQTPYPSRYNRTLSSASGLKWTFSNWTADLVVICLGTNDYSTEPVPDDSMFIGDYHKLIATITGNYPDAAVVCVGTHDTLLRSKVATVVAEEQTQLSHPQVFGAQFPDSLALTACDFHPSITDNQAIAAVLVDIIMKRLGWDTTATGVRPGAWGMRTPAKQGLTITCQGKLLKISTALPVGSSDNILLVTPSGVMARAAGVNLSGQCFISTDRLSAGLYLAGNRSVGWKPVTVRD